MNRLIVPVLLVVTLATSGCATGDKRQDEPWLSVKIGGKNEDGEEEKERERKPLRINFGTRDEDGDREPS